MEIIKYEEQKEKWLKESKRIYVIANGKISFFL